MKTFFLSTLSKAMNAYLELDPESQQRVHRLRGRSIAIELLPFHFYFQCKFTDAGIEIASDQSILTETTLRGTPMQLVSVMLAKENRHQFFADDLIIEGNAELGQQVTDLFDNMQIDWEEHLSHLTGDAPAYHVGRAVRGIATWLRKTKDTLADDVNEYIHEEKEWFPAREALNDFFNDIDALRMDIDRMEARTNLLLTELTNNEAGK